MLYIKKLTPQELGYRNGSLRTGGYFYISKRAAKSFFGLLSKAVLNDCRRVEIYTPDKPERAAEATYVFHNDKHVLIEGTRDEYRVYLNKQIQFHEMHYRPDDIVVFSTHPRRFMLHHFKTSHAEYHKWRKILIENGRKGNHAIIEGI